MSKPTIQEMLQTWQKRPDVFFRTLWPDIVMWDKLQEVCDSVVNNRRTSIRSGHGIGKCLARGTPVLMYDGTIQSVENVCVGDKLMGDDSTPRNVLSLARGTEEMYRVTLYDGTFYDVNKSHILSLVATQSHGKQKTGDIVNVSVREWLTWSERKKRTHAGYRVSVDYPKRSEPLCIDPYILGIWLGDGTSIRPDITNEDPEIIEVWREEAKKRGMVIHEYTHGGTTYSMTNGYYGGHNSLKDDLCRYNLSGNKHIPFVYLTASHKERLELLAGLIDTGGYLAKDKRGFEITQKSKQLAHDIQRLARSVGIHATLRETTKSAHPGHIGTYYRLFLTQNIEKIPVKVHRRKPNPPNSTKNTRRNLHFGIKSIESLGIGEYFGFTIDGNSLFLLGDFTVTHNTWVLARLAIWFLTCFKPSIVLTTAPTGRQVEKLLWGELHSAYNSAKIPLGGKLLNTQWKITENNYAIGFATNESLDQREFGSTKLQGFHSPNLLILLDEAAGIPQEIYTAISSLITGDNNRVIAIGNPTSPTGPFFETFKSSIWHNINISCFDHPNIKTGKTVIPGAVTKEWLEERKEEWGENTPLWEAKVLGNFPKEGADTLIPLTWIENAINNVNKIEPTGKRVIGADIARYGEDETVRYRGTGKFFEFIEATRKEGTMQTAGRLIADKRDHNAEIIAVDDTGVGGGVTDRLNELGEPVLPLNFGAGAKDAERFANLKAEIFWLLRESLRKTECRLPDDDKLKNQLASIKFKYTSKGQIQIESKDDMKKRGLKSPDRADALAITHYAVDSYIMPELLWIG